MNNEDMSDIIQKLSSMVNNSSSESINTQDTSSNSSQAGLENLQYILSNMNLGSKEEEDNRAEENNNSSSSNNFNIDFETIMRMKNLMDKVNSTKNSPEANLLLSLKPYLNNNRKQKLDQYMQFLNITKVIGAFNSGNGGNNNDIHKQ